MIQKVKNKISIAFNYLRHHHIFKKINFSLQVFHNLVIKYFSDIILTIFFVNIISHTTIYSKISVLFLERYETLSTTMFNYVINLVSVDTLVVELSIIFLLFCFIVLIAVYLKTLIKSHSIYKHMITITAYFFAVIFIFIDISFETYYPNFKIVSLVLPLFVLLYLIFIQVCIITKLIEYLNKNVSEYSNVIQMLKAVNYNSVDFLLISNSTSINQFYSSYYLRNQYGLSCVISLQNKEIYYFVNFAKSHLRISYFYSTTIKHDFLNLLKILKIMYYKQESKSLIFLDFINFMNTKGHNNSHNLREVLKFIFNNNLHIIPEILNNFKSHTHELPLNFIRTREILILNFLIEHFELIFEGFNVQNTPQDILFLNALKKTLDHVLQGDQDITKFLNLNYYSYIFFLVDCGLQLNEQEYLSFFSNIIININLELEKIPPKHHQDILLFDNKEYHNHILILIFKHITQCLKNFYTINPYVIIFLLFYLFWVMGTLLFSNIPYLFYIGVINEVNSLAPQNYFLILFFLFFFIYRRKDLLDPENKLGIPNSIFVLRAIIFAFFIIFMSLTSKPYLKVLLIIIKFLILFCFSLYAKKKNKNYIKLRIIQDFRESFGDLNKLSKDVPFVILLPLDARLNPEYNNILKDHFYHFDIKTKHFQFGVYSPSPQIEIKYK